MSDELSFGLGELLGLEPRCDFLGEEEQEALLEGSLSPERRRAFEEHAVECPSCSELMADVEMFRALSAGGGSMASERRAFRASDARVRRDLGLEPGRRARRPMAFGLLAASVAAAALMIFILVPRAPEPVLFQEIDVVPLVPPPSVRGGPSVETWEEARVAWEADDFAGVVTILSPALDEAPADESLLFYLGVVRLRLGDHDQAVEILTRLDRLQADLPSENTRWYLAAALDGAGRREEACGILRSISDMGSTRAVEAQRIVRRGCPAIPSD